MEQGTYFLYLSMALLLPFLLLKFKHRSRNGVRLPPGPWRLPVIGSLHHLIGKPLVHRALADLARTLDAPLMYLKLGEVPVVVASSPAAASEIMRDHDATFASRPFWNTAVRVANADGQGLGFAPYGELWRQLRRISVVELLSARRVQSFHRVREEEVARLVAGVAATSAAGETVNVGTRVAAAVADSAVRAIIGDRFERREEFLETIEEMNKLVSEFSLGQVFPSSWFVSLVSGVARRAQAYHLKSFELMEHAIKQHEERRATMAADGRLVVEDEDILDVLLRTQKEGDLNVPLTMGNIKAVIFDLFGGGMETSATTLQWAMSELMRNPNVMKRAQHELRGILNGKAQVTEDDLIQMKYLKFVIKETLRLHPTVPLVARESRESCKILGYDVPKGTTMFVNAWALGRDPKYWKDAGEFKPERFEGTTIDFKGSNFEYIPFGSGRRICPGILFAISNMELTLAALLYHFDWALPVGIEPTELDMEEELGIVVRRKNDLHLHSIVYVPPLQCT